MRSLLARSILSFSIALAAACADDIPEVMTEAPTSSDGDTTTGSGPVTLTADPSTDSTGGSADTTAGSADSTGTSGTGSGTDTADPVCGDDVAEGSEPCDGTDLNGSTCISQGFDEGTLTCRDDCNAFDTSACVMLTCGNDVIEGRESCDGADLGGSDCLTAGFDGGTLACMDDCTALDTSGCTTCGDGLIEGDEQCEPTDLVGETCQTQGFDFGELACSSSCSLDLENCVDIISETEPNDDTMVAVNTNDFSAVNANGPYAADTLIAAAINPAGDDDVFAVTNPGPNHALISLETYGSIPGMCEMAVDTFIDLRTDLNVLLLSNDDGGVGGCSLISDFILPPGVTIYVRVIDFGDNSVIPAYHLHIRIDPVVCGDGVAGPGEQCDDGGVVDGDGCSAACVAEDAIQELEPNDTSLQADATGIVATGDALFGGSIPAIGDLDQFRLDLAAPQVVRFETFSAVGVCEGGIATTLRIFDDLGAQLVSDTNSGIANCSAIVFPLPAGTFYVQVEETGNNSLVPTYLLELAVQADTGLETEPNEDELTASANFMGGGSELYVFGDHALNTDSDYYAIDVAVDGSALRIEAIEGDRAIETCESNGVDTRITLYDAAGVELVDDDDDGRGFCSKIDGTGAAPADAAADGLAVGTYYVQVRASSFSQMSPAGQFIYRLAVSVREP